ncbi:Ppx/GppA phosphatase family protein [Ponticaulis profundi]|uniref:Ppx/GppA phosphatase family protein n=1 Tax=Ponticaulis profundi TaxID=2665222 RepID=A0ABW1SFM6_9PROT
MLTSKASQKKGRRRAKPAFQSKSMFAAVDLGTNNCRLLIAEPRGKRFRVVDSYSQIVRLGEGMSASGVLSDDAISRTLSALQDIRQKIKGYPIRRIRCVATQACRVASNGREFVERVQRETGLTFKVISPKEEAQLAVVGALDLVDAEKDVALVVDIGGGSTELCWVDARKANKIGLNGALQKVPMLNWASFPIGVVTLSEMFPERNDPDWYPQMLNYARSQLESFKHGSKYSELFEKDQGHLIGTSGTVTSLCAVHMNLDRYIRSIVDGAHLSRVDAIAARERLSGLTREERSLIPCIGDGRSDLVLAGCAIMEAVWQLWPCSDMRVADRGLREGLLLSLIHGKPPKKRRRSGKKKTANAETATEGQPAHDG